MFFELDDEDRFFEMSSKKTLINDNIKLTNFENPSIDSDFSTSKTCRRP
jgi:hypothetical protein